LTFNRHCCLSAEHEELKMAPRREEEYTKDEVEEIVDVDSKADEKPTFAPGVKIEWSDEDDGDVYEKFKNRKVATRKRTAATKRKAQGATTKAGKKKRVKEDDDSDHKKPKKEQRERVDDSDDDLMDYSLPDYLKDRRSKFDHRKEVLKQLGLKLPPDFDGIDFSGDERLHELREKPDFPTAKPARKYEDIQLPYSLGLIPAPIAQWLREYQVQGTAFLHELFVYQKGGILGDDMGLGKTVQVIAFLTAAYGKTGDERDAKRMRKMRRRADGRWYPRTLIVCPGTLIQNWKSEFQRWGWWNVDAYLHDNKEAALQGAKSGRIEVMITTYATYRMNKGDINMIEWDCVVADECHIIKERHSGTTEAMNEVNALCRIGLTGTAIQNKYEELWTLLNWTNPGQFGPVSVWKSSISDPLKIGQSHDATVYQLSKARKTAKKLVENLLPQFFLRRMKTCKVSVPQIFRILTCISNPGPTAKEERSSCFLPSYSHPGRRL
jgi:DNA excision repair protein ERCC-6-like 2